EQTVARIAGARKCLVILCCCAELKPTARRGLGPVVQRRRQWRNGTLFAVYLLQLFLNATEGLTMKRRGLIAFAAAGVIIGGAWLITATAIRAQQQPAPAAPPTEAVPPIGPYDPKLRTVSLPTGKKVHLLPATLETTQWGWFDNAQPPVL